MRVVSPPDFRRQVENVTEHIQDHEERAIVAAAFASLLEQAWSDGLASAGVIVHAAAGPCQRGLATTVTEGWTCARCARGA